MPKRKQLDTQTIPRSPHPSCEMPGCCEHGEYRAPVSPKDITHYRWFCLEHVREYNANWDYFDGMGAKAIEDFMKDAMLGHRPTWKVNSQKLFNTDHLHEALHVFTHGDAASYRAERKAKAESARQTDNERRILAVMDLEGEVSLAEVKKQYKMLVKKYHPDVNKGNTKAEERFKRITEAYQEWLKIKKS